MQEPRKIILIYGPPAVGKYTIGDLLAKRLDANFFHNHIMFDVAIQMLPKESSFDMIKSLGCKLRLNALGLLMEYTTNHIITTFCYFGKSDDWYIQSVQNICDKYGAELHFIQLKAETIDLLHRVENQDRSNFFKVNNKEELENILVNRDYFIASIDSEKHLIKETSLQTPEQIVDDILKYLLNPLTT